MQLFSDFLGATSIHGLRYLAEAKNIVIRALWFLCISASFSAAVIIIYGNVVQWQNSPSVISQAKPILVQVDTITTLLPKAMIKYSHFV